MDTTSASFCAWSRIEAAAAVDSSTSAVPAGASNLSFTTSGGSGDMDLYVKSGSTPTDTVYDCRPYRTGNAETCTFNNPTAGSVYYVNVRAYSSFSGVTLKATRTP